MLGPYFYTKRDKYPHLSEAEAAIWERYIEKYPDAFDEVTYDIELGIPQGFDPNRPEPWRSHHKYLGGYKIDVLGRKGEVVTIVELKKEATTKALGEIWLYEYLYKAFKPGSDKCELMIVTDREMPHVREVCEADGVKLVVV